MKLEKFDYQIGNKKQKNSFIALGVLCIALVVTVVLYRTFASFSDSASFNIIKSKVGMNDHGVELLRVNISKEGEGNEVYAVYYDDNTLSIDGTGEMKDFDQGNDLIGEVLDAYIAQNVTFTSEEQTFINDHKKFMNTMFDYAARSFLVRDESKITQKISETFVDQDSNPVAEDIAKATTIINKVKESGFNINQIEIINDVKNIGKYAFSLVDATHESDIRDNFYPEISNTWDYTCNKNASQSINLLALKANFATAESVGERAMVDVNPTNIEIGEGITILPNDIFASYNGGKGITCSEVGVTYHANNVDDNLTLVIPATVTEIGQNAFYSFDGKTITFEERTNRIDFWGSYAFANFYSSGDLYVPYTVSWAGQEIFRDFPGNAYIVPGNNCNGNTTFRTVFFPNAAGIYSATQSCSLEP